MKTITIIDKDNTKTEAECIIEFELKATKRDFLVYTLGEMDEDNNVTVYVSRVERNGTETPVLTDMTDEEWEMVQKVLKELSK